MPNPNDAGHNSAQYESDCVNLGGYWTAESCQTELVVCCNLMANGVDPGPYHNQMVTCQACEFFAGACEATGPCQEAPEPDGCCTLPDGSTTMTTQDGCLLQGGSFAGPNIPCPDPTGCCSFTHPDDDFIGTNGECIAAGGFYNGDGSTCSGGTPPPPPPPPGFSGA